jgi:hypothetical protein
MGHTPISPKTFIDTLAATSMVLVDASFQVRFLIRGYNGPLFPSDGDHLAMLCMERLHLTLVNPSVAPWLFKFIHLPNLRMFWVEATDFKGWKMKLYASLLEHATKLEYLALSDPLTVTGHQSMPNLGVESKTSSWRSLDPDLDLEALFEGIKYAHTVFFPTGIYMQTALLEKIASGHLLPFLHHLIFSSTNVQTSLEFIRKRYEYSVRSMHLPTTSQSVTITIPRPLASVYLTYIRIGTGPGNDNGDPRIVFNELCPKCVGTRIKMLDVNLKVTKGPLFKVLDSNNIHN